MGGDRSGPTDTSDQVGEWGRWQMVRRKRASGRGQAVEDTTVNISIFQHFDFLHVGGRAVLGIGRFRTSGDRRPVSWYSDICGHKRPDSGYSDI